MLNLEATAVQFLEQLLLLVAAGMACPRVIHGPLLHMRGNRENQRAFGSQQLFPLSQAVQILRVVLQHFKCNDEAKLLVQLEEVLCLELYGSGAKALALLMLGDQFSVEVETKPRKATTCKILKESAAAHSNFKEPPRWHSGDEPIGKEPSVKISQRRIRRVWQFANGWDAEGSQGTLCDHRQEFSSKRAPSDVPILQNYRGWPKLRSTE
jgi:hypothetical protein